jgi:hypothetical protein
MLKNLNLESQRCEKLIFEKLVDLFLETCHSKKKTRLRKVPSLRAVGKMMPDAVIACPMVDAIVEE